MTIHPQLQAFAAGAAQFPKAGSVPVATLRDLVRQASTAFPPVTVPIGTVEDRSIDGPGGALPIRVYTPAGDGPWPVVVYFHGGGWVVGDLDTQDMICRGLCHGAQSVILSVGYRLAPEHPFPAAPDDCWAATLWADAHSGDLNGIPGQIAVAGDSAGAVLAAGVALRARDAGGPALRAQVLIYGPCDYPSLDTPSVREFRDAPILGADDALYFWGQYLSDPERERTNPLAAPVRAASHTGLAPAFVCVAEIDPSRDDAEAYGQTLMAAGVPVMMRRYIGMLHGFVSWLGMVDAAQDAIDDASAWLKMHFATARR